MTASVFDQLDAEWARLCRHRRTAARLPEVCAAAGGARDLAEVERFVRRGRPADVDAVLLALVSRAVVGDALAARVTLQLLMPGTRALARRWWAVGEPDERAAAAVMAVYHRIRRYPLARRPGRVAANVLMDAAQELRRAVPDPATVVTADPGAHQPPGARGGDPARPAADELADVLRDAVACGIVDADDALVIARSRIAGDRVADLAERRGLRPRTLWSRRQQAERALVAAHALAG